MSMRALALFLFMCAVALMLWMFPRLPEPMASQFSFDGAPTRWTSRASFVTTFITISGMLNVMFLGGIASLLNRVSTPRFNVPNKEYWLSTPERCTEALDRLHCYLCKAAVFANLLILLSLHLVAQGNGVPVAFEIPPDAIGPLLLGTVGAGVLVLALWAQSDFAVPSGRDRVSRPDPRQST